MQLRICTKCKKEMSIDLFCKDKQKKGGLSLHCRPCRSARAAAKYSADRDTILARNKEWAKNNPEKYKEARRAYLEANADSSREYKRAWLEKNREKSCEYSARWRKNNPDRVWKASPEKAREAALRWQKNNKARVLAYNAARYAAKLKATPKWANLKEIAKFYEEAEQLAKVNGEPYHVDHVIPLRSKIVCGLHCEANLRVIKADENRSKGNRYWPDMP